MSNWVEEFSNFQGGAGGVTTGGGMKSTYAPQKQTRTEKIQAELKLLEWHKLANDAALKAALMQTKNLREKTPEMNETTNAANTKRIRQIVTNEQTKPLEVTRDFVLRYEQSEIKNSERLTEQVERHISTLRGIREKLESKVELKGRINEYREWKQGFMAKKNAVMNGQTLASLDPKVRHSQDNESAKSSGGATQELATVLDSLNKLAQLENRITDLETNNVYQKMSDLEDQRAYDAQQKTALEFNKRRATGGNAKASGSPSRTIYAIRQKKVPLHKGATLRGAPAASRRGKTGGGTFLTEGGDTTADNRRDAINRERQRKIAQASSGQKTMRSRVLTKKQRQLSDVNSHKKHEVALAELQKRRSQQAERMKNKRKQVTEGKGASGMRKYKHKHVEDFQNMKREHRDRKENRRAAAAERTRGRAVRGGGGASTIGSNTMPEIRRTNRGGSRQPATRTAGTVTRRRPAGKSVPVRRGRNSQRDDDNIMPPIVGSGVRGARKIKQQRGSGLR
mmetsp:Transcript_518/g.1211  ORF Transcript_518/g.1211 Transcript_518/m.1211 type:complete len:510 (+) Transcript_518:197-1726(+)